MSFTSQNYGVAKKKRMDRVLIDCVILSVVVALVLGGGAYIFGDKLLRIYTSDSEVVRCGCVDFVVYSSDLFYVRIDGFAARIHAGNGIFAGSHDFIDCRNGGNENCMDLWCVSKSSFSGCIIYFLSGILDYYNIDAGGVLCICT